MFDWDDLRIFLGAARAGSLTAASLQLGVDAATVGRRIARLEGALKATLFTRSAQGLQLTSAGARLLEAARHAESAMAEALEAGSQDTVGGTVRISAAEGFGAWVIAPALPRLQAQRPGLRIELAAQAGFLSPSRREVDIAVTLSAPVQARLVVEPLTDYDLGLYAARSFLQAAPAPKKPSDLHGLPLVGYVDDLIFAPELRYLDEIHPGLRPMLSSSSIQAQKAMVAAGAGIGVLPCFLAQDLERVLPQVRLRRRFWISTHRDVASTARARTVRAWLGDLVARRRADLMPDG